ncbi:MAG: fibrillarin-like rRNA/tRNA 2'-O-methyltransferase [Candidatus Thalassarchaeaceae archaeon]|nr:fibrillarin-like rRNA/tRNA 2'-O-methyltransferase [Candidatus Thalassarchaeaceae archaeon]
MRRKSLSLGWGIRREGRNFWTRNAVKGVSVRKEKRKRDGRNEWRHWNTTKSKISASLLRTKKDPRDLLPEVGQTCLYLGASVGGTVSHIHDCVCGSGNHHRGKIFAVDISPRMMRDLVQLCDKRPGIFPILADARNISELSPFIQKKVDWLHQDLSIADQAKTFIKVSEAFLKRDGVALLSLKGASERNSEGDMKIRFQNAKTIIESSRLEIIEIIDLKGLEEQHILFNCKLR